MRFKNNLRNRLFSWKQACQIRASKKSQAELARKYKVSQVAISAIIQRKTYQQPPREIFRLMKEANKQRLLRRRATEKGLKLKDILVVLKKSCCDICGAVKSWRWKTLNIDHNHKTKRVRGLLCTRCNWSIGAFKDSPELLRRAADYLEKFE